MAVAKVKRDQIVRFMGEYLKVSAFEDYCHNGLQVAGAPLVSRIITGVSISKKLIEIALREKAQMLLVHHGLFGNQFGKPPQIQGLLARRLKMILESDLNLCGYHLPLDAHPEIGNNVSICRLLGIKKLLAVDVGWVGDLSRKITLDAFVSRVDSQLATESKVLASGPAAFSRVGVISGGSSNYYIKMAEAGAEAFICGDFREEIVRGAEEVGINIINAGHYNSERLGIIKLGQLLAKRFKISVDFVEVPCEV